MLADILNPLWWFSFFGQTFRWWFVCQLLGIIAFPICFLVFRTFRDRGYALSRVFGILLLTWINWYLCTVLRFSFLSVLLALLIFAAVSLFCIVRRRAELTAWVRKSWKTMLTIDLVFLFTFLFFVNVRSYRPEAMFDPGHSGAEKMMNCAYLHALMRSPHFPPGNTWLWGEDTRPVRDTAAVEATRKGEAEAGTAVEASGKKPAARRTRKFLINYYYFGHLQWATLAKLSGYPAHVAFNLGLATVFALTFTAALCLGLNMTRRWPWAFLCAFMIAFFGNLDPLQQMIQRIGFWITHKAANITAWQSVWAQRRIVFTTVDFWRTSRIMDNTVTEFPYFSAILGDLHPHHMSLPLVLLGIGAGLALVQAVRRPWTGMKEFFRGHGLRLLMFAFVIGGTFAANTWDAIVMGFFAFCLMFYLVLKHQGAGWKSFIQAGFLVLGTGLSAVLLFTLFKLNFESPVKNEIIVKSWFPLEFEKFKMLIGSVPWKIRTDLTDYLVFFGLMLVPVALYVRRRAASLFSGMTPGARIAWLAVSLMVLTYSRGVWRFWLPGAALLWLSVCMAFLLSRRDGPRGDYFSLLCIVVAFFTLFIEIFFFDDRMVGDLERYNSLFKIYYPLWSFLSVAAAWAFARLFRCALRERAAPRFIMLSLLLAAVFILGMLYPVQSTAVRTEYFQRSEEYQRKPSLRHRTLDASDYLGSGRLFTVKIGNQTFSQVSMKDDKGIIDWIRGNIQGQPVIMESVEGCYVPFSRISTMTGVPTLIGWSHHIAQHHGGAIYEVIGPRERDIDAIYKTAPPEKALELLRKYNVSYVVVGVLERLKYNEESLSRLDTFLEPVFTSGKSILYKVPSE